MPGTYHQQASYGPAGRVRVGKPLQERHGGLDQTLVEPFHSFGVFRCLHARITSDPGDQTARRVGGGPSTRGTDKVVRTIKRAGRRRLLTLLLVATAMVAGIALTPMAANAVHAEGLFELDGNIADNAGAVGQDWSAFQGPLAPGDTAPISTAFISDGFNGLDDTIYFGGGSQNNNDISELEVVVRQRLDEERHRARVRLRVHQEQRALPLLRRRPLRPDRRHDERRLLVPPERRRAPGRQRLPRWRPGDQHLLRSARGWRPVRLRGVHRRRRRLRREHLRMAQRRLDLLAAKSSGSFCSADDSICAQTNSETIPSTVAL